MTSLQGPQTATEPDPSRASKLIADGVAIEYVVKRTRQKFLAVEDITFQMKPHSLVCVVGPSGCGKTSFLGVVAGLQPYSAGTLTLDGRPINGPGADRAVVFQQAALLPWRTTLDNVTYGLELRGLSKEQARPKARDMIRLVGLENNEGSYPHTLSGGMRQRVNLARALAADPELLLLDEPFAALDAQTRELMQDELLRIWTETRKTALFITHQIDEAVYLGDQVVVLSKGPRSRVQAIIDIEFDRPRVHSLKRTPAFLDVVDHIWKLVRTQQMP